MVFVSDDVDSVQTTFPVEWDKREFVAKPDCNLERDLERYDSEETMHRW